MALSREDVIGLAVAMGTPLATAEANYDAAFPAPTAPAADDVIGGGIEVRADGEYRITTYGDGRREETKL